MAEPLRWTQQRANDWYARQPWLVGCNFTPSTAVNQLEMWQASTFDAETIDRELAWAAGLGFNSMRVFLHDLAWHVDEAGFRERIDRYLGIASAHGVGTLFVIFDDCWHPDPKPGKQPEPRPGVHNSGWVQSPGEAALSDPAEYPRLESYVKGVVGAFGHDERVLAWDLYNEPTNLFLPAAQTLTVDERRAAFEAAARQRGERLPDHLRLLDMTFEWARAARPQQPLTAGVYTPDRELNARLIGHSDVVSFHSYEDAATLEKRIARLRQEGRPLLCTEWLARTRGSAVATHLPIFKRERVACYNWGLVNGKTQTHISWTGEDEAWFHDVLRPDGTPYDASEAEVFRSLTARVG